MILYIVKWSLIYIVLIFLLHNLYLFFQNNLTTTKFKDYYNTFPIESVKINSQLNEVNSHKPNNLQISNTDELNSVFSKEFNNDFNNDFNKEFNKDFNKEFNKDFNNNTMKTELNDFLSKLNYE